MRGAVFCHRLVVLHWHDGWHYSHTMHNRSNMLIQPRSLKPDEIFRLAVQARLMVEDGESFCLNDLAGSKELLAFTRLVELRTSQSIDSDMTGAE